MPDYTLGAFIIDCGRHVSTDTMLADTVRRIAPLMRRLLAAADEFLGPEHFQPDPDHYARNLVFDDEAAGLSLYTLVWQPGQWTPIHDHGTWGVVGVIEGQLEEQSYLRADPGQNPERHDGIELQRGSLVLLSPGSVSTFVPNPDHIHKTGCAEHLPRCVSLHLYGRAMNSFYAYDVGAGTRSLIEVAHRETRLGEQE
jgi:predicted metal-dependent enzyme (double-stranded beta helix superfamily)